MNPASNGRRVLVLEPDDQLASAISNALREANPEIAVDRTRSLEEAQNAVVDTKPDLFVLDLDAAADLSKDFLYDLRTSHPDARAIVLTGVHLEAARERTAGLGAIHLLEKPFPHADFVDLVQALLQPEKSPDAEKFQGTLSDLHIADIIQLKCMSGATAGIDHLEQISRPGIEGHVGPPCQLCQHSAGIPHACQAEGHFFRQMSQP